MRMDFDNDHLAAFICSHIFDNMTSGIAPLNHRAIQVGGKNTRADFAEEEPF